MENFIRVLTGRLPPSTPRSKRLLSDNRSNILIYMTGHGGDGFLKFQVLSRLCYALTCKAFFPEECQINLTRCRLCRKVLAECMVVPYTSIGLD